MKVFPEGFLSGRGLCPEGICPDGFLSEGGFVQGGFFVRVGYA